MTEQTNSPSAPDHAASRVKTAMVFVQDRDSEGVIRQCLSDLAVPKPEFISGTVDSAIAAFKERPSPMLLIVDIDALEDPTTHIRELANVCDPGTGVIVVGDSNDIRMYRSLKASGVVEYYFKPLVRSMLVQTCSAILTGNKEQAPSRSGKLIVVVSVRGGSGGTMITVLTATHMAVTNKRRVGLIDMDMQYGDAALQLDTAPTHGLKEALDHPERVDELFLERAVIHVGERLGLLAGLEPLDDIFSLNEASVLSLLEQMLHRYRYVIVDMPANMTPRLMRVLQLPGTVVLVSTATLTAARDVARWRAKIGPNTSERNSIHVMNRSESPNSLPLEEFTRAVGQAPDIVIPFTRDISAASRLGVTGLMKNPALLHSLMPLFSQLSGEEPTLMPKSWLRELFS